MNESPDLMEASRRPPIGRSMVVVKVGGSLLDWPELPTRLGRYLASRRSDLPAIVVGGGPAADVVRGLDRAHALEADRAHALAIRALDLTAHVLAAIVPGLVVVERADALPEVWEAGRVPIFLVRPFLDADDLLADDPLPRCWDVTTDSIAARVAVRLGAAELTLLKSAPLPPGADREVAAQLGLVDPAFPAVARPLWRVSYRNLRDPQERPADWI